MLWLWARLESVRVFGDARSLGPKNSAWVTLLHEGDDGSFLHVVGFSKAAFWALVRRVETPQEKKRRQGLGNATGLGRSVCFFSPPLFSSYDFQLTLSLSLSLSLAHSSSFSEFTFKPVIPPAGSKSPYPLRISQPKEFVRRYMLLMKVGLKAMLVFNGVAGLAQCLGYLVPKVPASVTAAATDAVGKLDQASSVAEFDVLQAAVDATSVEPGSESGAASATRLCGGSSCAT